MAAVGVFVGASLTLEPVSWITLIPSALTVIFICGAGNVFNDLKDVEIDQFAHPDRVIVAGRLSMVCARRLGWGLNVLGAVVALFINLPSALLAWLAIGFLFAYNYFLKRVPLAGNFIIALLAGGVVLMGGMALAPEYAFELPGPIIGGLFAFLVHLMREIVKDIQDMEADRRFGLRSLPMLIGVRSSLLTVALFAVILCFAIFWPYREEWFGRYYLYIAAVGVIAPVLATIATSILRPSDTSIRVLATTLKVAMGFGLLALLAA